MTDLTTLLYDWDNTLVDGWAGIAAALNAVFGAFAMPLWTAADTRARVRVSLRESFPVMFGAEWERARDIFYATLEEQHLHHVAPMPGAADALAAGRAWPQGVVSNKAGKFLRAEVAHLGWAPHFGAVIGAGDAVRRQAGSRRRSCWRSIAWAAAPTARSGTWVTPRWTCRPRAPPASPRCWSAMPRTMVALTGRPLISISYRARSCRTASCACVSRVADRVTIPGGRATPARTEQEQQPRQEEGSSPWPMKNRRMFRTCS